jgi:hypothetical protein
MIIGKDLREFLSLLANSFGEVREAIATPEGSLFTWLTIFDP